MTKIKICGISRSCDIEAVNRYGPDYCGFIFAEKSPRRVTAEQAVELKRLLSPEIKAVGVFVDARPEEAAKLAEAGVIDLIQLHGHETEAYLEELRELAQVPVIRAFSIREPADLEKAAASSADYFLLDNGAGGSGRAFDWGLLDDRGSCGRSGAAGHAEASVAEGFRTGKNAGAAGTDGKALFSGRRPYAGQCGRGGPAVPALCGGSEQRAGDGRGKGPGENQRMYQEDKKCLKEDLESSEASTFRKLL